MDIHFNGGRICDPLLFTKFILYLFFIASLGTAAGCSQQEKKEQINEKVFIPEVVSTRKDDSTACAYWKCSKEKKMYLQKYVRQSDNSYKPAGAYKLDGGIGAFPLEDLDKFQSDGEAVDVNDGKNECPYCGSDVIALCPECNKTFCGGASVVETGFLGAKSIRLTCPWCNHEDSYGSSGSWGVGGGG